MTTDFWDGVASRIGYDFSSVKIKKAGLDPEKEFFKDLEKILDKDKIVIDIGTADGQLPLMIANRVKRIVAVDISKIMIKKAVENLGRTNVGNVRFEVADARHLPFPDKSFDVAISRRGPVTSNTDFLGEVYRILKSGGEFVEITIGERDKENIKKIFGRGQNYEYLIENRREIARKKRMLEDVGFEKTELKEIDCVEYYETMEDLIFLLENTPIIPDFDTKKDRSRIEEIRDSLSTAMGIRTNSHRIIIYARK
ncbi:MAG: class I SAM-dependent methyltransferase [Candidatus Aenigmarchaeota archaeon]|nr:class I SAM-dependent methyltransferase [Candidatus Aenigmarchaeota archaeon]